MNKFINKIYIKALVGANMAKNELQKMRASTSSSPLSWWLLVWSWLAFW